MLTKDLVPMFAVHKKTTIYVYKRLTCYGIDYQRVKLRRERCVQFEGQVEGLASPHDQPIL